MTNALALSAGAISPLRRIRWLRFETPLMAFVVFAHLVFEGPRWQMYPVYSVTGLLLSLWLIGNLSPLREILAGITTGHLATRVFVGAGSIGLATSIALGMILPVFRFPRPHGPFPIGTVTYRWLDPDRHEAFSSDPSAHRELMAQVWYPARAISSSSRAPYVTDADALSAAIALQLHLPTFTFDYWRYVATNAVPSAPIATVKPSYPVLIFVSGVDGYRQSNTFQVEELVSHGYVVVGLDQPYVSGAVTFPDGHVVTGSKAFLQPLINQSLGPPAIPRAADAALPDGVIRYLAQDVRFALDQLVTLNRSDPYGILTGHLDMQRAGVFGMSLGAIVTGEACHLDPRLRACLMMDAAMTPDVVEAGLAQPSMWLTRDAATMRLEHWTEPDITQALGTMTAAWAKSSTGLGYLVKVRGMFHLNFTDAPYYSPLAPQLGVTGPIDGQRGHEIVNAYTLAFFDHFLEGDIEEALDGSSSQFPEATLLAS